MEERLSKIRLSVVVCGFALFAACGSSNVPTRYRGDLFDQGYPLKIGNRWEYAFGVTDEFITTNRDLEEEIVPVTFSGIQIWEVAAIDTIDGQAAFRIDINSQVLSGEQGRIFSYGREGKESNSSTWLAVRGDTLVQVMSTVSQLDEGFSMKPVQSAQTVVLLVLPLRLGASWPLSPGRFSPFSRTVLRVENVTVGSSQLQAFRLSTANPLAKLWREEHWYGAPGLVRYSRESEIVLRRNDELGNPLEDEILSTTFVAELISYQLQ
jgi:hypothetical protein